MTTAHPRQIILDTETTGFHHSATENPDRLIEFAGLEMVNRQLTEHTLHLYIHPERDIPAEATAIHGITLDQLAGKPTFAQGAQQIPRAKKQPRRTVQPPRRGQKPPRATRRANRLRIARRRVPCHDAQPI